MVRRQQVKHIYGNRTPQNLFYAASITNSTKAGIGVVVFIYFGIFTGILKTGSLCRKWHSYNDKQTNENGL